MILDTVAKFVREEEILLVVSNFGDKTSNSSDIDIYCVTRGKSSVQLFYNEKREWVELFIDNISDVYKKIENVDEIAINFIRELKFVSGSREVYSELLARTSVVVGSYHLPPTRKNLLKYRVKVLLSKYLKPEAELSSAQEHFILNAITYPIIQLVLEHHNIFPSSPNRWLIQLQHALPINEFDLLSKFLAHQCDRDAVITLCEKYADKPDPISIKKAKDNDLTLLS